MAEAVLNRTAVHRISFHLSAIAVLLLALATRVWAGGINLAWDPVTGPTLAGYMVYYGTAAGSYTGKIDVGNQTSYSVANLADGATYHFAVTAYDTSRVESNFSNDASGTVVAGAPVANFVASTTSGAVPLAMNFTSTSTGSITAYAWNFGDGTSSASASPGHVYSAAGVFTVSLTVSGSAGSSTKTIPNYVTVTAASDTTPPSAPSTLVGSAGGTSANLSWYAASDNVGVAGYRVERCDGSACTDFAQIASPVATAYTDSGRTAGSTYSYRVRAIDAAGNLGTYSNTVAVSIPGTASVVGALVTSSAAVNLSVVGTSDWIEWPYSYRKLTGASQISGYGSVGAATINSYTNDARAMNWSDGTPYPSGSLTSGASVSTPAGGMQFTVPADTTTRTLVVYVGAQNTTGTLRAHLSDGSSADYVGSYSAQQRRIDGQFTLTYRAATSGQTLTVAWVKSNSKSGNVTLQGAALSSSSPASAGTCPCSAWTAASTPVVADNPDWSPVELGMKFRADVAGLITGLRFYKSAANTGTHLGNLWRSEGTLLAQATFVNETASGWQQVSFNPPIPVAANTTYVASYHTDAGHYAGDNWFFTNGGVDNGYLHVLRDGVDGGNGVYAYGNSSFPSSTYNATNYWVDVIFTTSP